MGIPSRPLRLEKLARALEVPMYQLFYDEEDSPTAPERTEPMGQNDCGPSRTGVGFLTWLRQSLGRMDAVGTRVNLFNLSELIKVGRHISM